MPRRVSFQISGPPVFNKDGVPRAKGRPRAVARAFIGASGQPEAIVNLVTPSETREAEEAIKAAFVRKHPGHKPFTGPVMLRFTAIFETPRSFNRAQREAAARGVLMATRKPDKDNIEKLIVDALNGIAFVDDAQVMGGGLKRYGSPARIEVLLESMDNPDVPATPGQKRAEKVQQARLPLRPGKPRDTNPPKPKSKAAIPLGDDKPPADLTLWSPRQRALIEAALARDEAAKRERERGR